MRLLHTTRGMTNELLGVYSANIAPLVSISYLLIPAVCLTAFFLALLYIHRTFFAQAMLDHPANPLRSPYAPSFLAAYRCASGMIKANLNHFER